jgi:hypothetical protein
MIAKEVKKLSDIELNIEVGECVGWVRKSPDSYGISWWIHPTQGEFRQDSPIKGCPFNLGDLPKYCNDLNAMNDALATLSDEQWNFYRMKLYQILDLGSCSLLHVHRKAHTATARQRAEAFVLTVKNKD